MISDESAAEIMEIIRKIVNYKTPACILMDGELMTVDEALQYAQNFEGGGEKDVTEVRD